MAGARTTLFEDHRSELAEKFTPPPNRVVESGPQCFRQAAADSKALVYRCPSSLKCSLIGSAALLSIKQASLELSIFSWIFPQTTPLLTLNPRRPRLPVRKGRFLG